MHVHYSLRVESLAGHLFCIHQSIIDPIQSSYTLTLPAWIPGSYMIRDFAKNLVEIFATDDTGAKLDLNKLDKQTWQVSAGSGNIHIHTIVYAYDWSVRSAYINEEYAFFNGTSVFLAVQGYQGNCTVDIELPDEMKTSWRIATSLPIRQEQSSNHCYIAEDYQELIDHPVVMGVLDLTCFEVEGVEFEFVLVGRHRADTQRICDDLRRICAHHLQLFGTDINLTKYLFITLLSHAGFGGLEHLSSTVLQYGRDQLPTPNQPKMSDGYRSFLSLCSHEFFHTWHVKRNKPEAFMALDLSQEVYTEQLWIYEGFTSYVDDLSLYRSGLIEQDSYLELVGQTLTRLARNPGAQKQTVTESSFDAWTRFYQQDASAANNIVSYYTKGAEIALCLDLTLRLQSGGSASLFSLLQIIWRDYGYPQKGTPNDVIQKIARDTLGIDIDNFLQNALYSTKTLPTAQLLQQMGVELKRRARTGPEDKGGKANENTSRVDFGALYKPAPLGAQLTQVLESTPAYQSKLNVGDIVLAIDNWQISCDTLQDNLDQHQPGETAVLHIIRDNRLMEKAMTIEAASLDTVYLQVTDQEKVANWLEKPEYSGKEAVS